MESQGKTRIERVSFEHLWIRSADPEKPVFFFSLSLSPSLRFTEASKVSLRKSRDEVILDQSKMKSFQTGDKWWLPGKNSTVVGQLGRELKLKSTSNCKKKKNPNKLTFKTSLFRLSGF